jgi:hypothetical protein
MIWSQAGVAGAFQSHQEEVHVHRYAISLQVAGDGVAREARLVADIIVRILRYTLKRPAFVGRRYIVAFAASGEYWCEMLLNLKNRMQNEYCHVTPKS